MTAPLPAPILTYVRHYVVRRRRIGLIRAGGLALSFGLAWILLACLADRWLQLNWIIRLALLLIGAAGFCAILLRPLGDALRRRVDWLEAAGEIERTTPVFGQRLRTVVSQLLERAEYRGSPQMLQELVEQVSATAVHHPRQPALSLGRFAAPWAAAALLTITLFLLRLSPSLGMPTLLERFVRPLSAIPPVTITRIAIEARSHIVRGDTLNIRAHVEKLGGGSVEIATSFNRKTWSHIPMLPAVEGDYLFSLPAMDRDLYYYVEAGDATTPLQLATVLRPPGLVEIRVSYDFPAYTHRGRITQSGTEGAIEAVAGTHVHAQIVCAEPLKSAAVSFADGQRLSLPVGPDPRTAQFDITLTQPSANWRTGTLELVSAAGLTTRIPGGLSLRAQLDHEPMVRLLQPGDDLRLDPRAVVAVQYQAMDDFALADLSAVLQVNASAPRRIALNLAGDARRQEGNFTLDLNALDVKVGDVVTLFAQGRDGAGHEAQSEVRHILIAPRSIDLNTRQRIAELRQAASMAAQVKPALESSLHLLEQILSRRDESEHLNLTDRLAISRSLADAVESSMVAHQSLLRACARATLPEEATALAQCVDQARIVAALCEDLSSLDSQGGEDRKESRELRSAIDAAQRMAAAINILWQGEQADAILADRANLKLAPATRPADAAAALRLEETLKRAKQDIAAAITGLGLRGDAPDLDDQLKRRSRDAHGFMKSSAPIDFAAAAAHWAKAVSEQADPAPPLPLQLLSASGVEAVRVDSDAAWASDLLLASHAAARIANLPLRDEEGSRTSAADALAEFPHWLSAMQAEHRAGRPHPDQGGSHAADPIHVAAADARRQLQNWSSASPDARLAAEDPAELAMAAAAQIWRRHYEPARDLDHQLATRLRSSSPSTPIELGNAWDQAQRIDQVSEDQELLSQQTSAASADPQSIAEQERNLAGQIQHLGSSTVSENSRAMATAAIQAIQESLAHMPQQLSTTLDAADTYRQAVERANQLHQDADAAAPQRRPMIQRMAADADSAAAEALELLDDQAQLISRGVSQEMLAQLKPYEADTLDAAQVISRQLEPALDALDLAVRKPDRAGVDRAAALTRAAIELTQDLLRQAQARLIERDPIQAAKWFADASADALAQRPPDLQKALGRQAAASLALGRAWQMNVRNGVIQRLGLTPTFRPILSTQPTTAPAAGAGLARQVPSIRQWGFLRPLDGLGFSSPLRDAEAPAFSEPIRLYFEGLSKAQTDAAPREAHPGH